MGLRPEFPRRPGDKLSPVDQVRLSSPLKTKTCQQWCSQGTQGGRGHAWGVQVPGMGLSPIPNA